MCGRTACTLAPDEVSRACSYRNRRGLRRQPDWRAGDADKYRPSYNKSPQSTSPVMLSRRHLDENAPVDECVLASMRWGLVPSWFKETDPSKMQFSTSNCRSENILQKKTYREPLLKGQRCVILADGFYEWRRQAKEKQPFFIYFPQARSCHAEKRDPVDESAQASQASDEWTGWRLLTIAGLFERWTAPSGGEPLYSYSVITVNASASLQGIHDRMPAVLAGEEEVRRWLDFGEVKSEDALKLLQSEDKLTYHPVSSLVNNSRNDSPECLQPVDPNQKKEAELSASGKMMRSWLASGSTKRKEPEAGDAQRTDADKKDTPRMSTGLRRWLQGPNKKTKTQ
ncbi:abasic site processing protein HMCES-like [Hippocampus zosterae]|uniref:abasic site processing protein HMCES-like n=1 Tax=Hippocampus zosterae TaxID=109293 RepID=UPI00223D8E9C|nr:abasic site processing protein HMCES-like [Hippocampus zosterae]